MPRNPKTIEGQTNPTPRPRKTPTEEAIYETIYVASTLKPLTARKPRPIRRQQAIRRKHKRVEITRS
ncbi:hypothetical protein ANCCAN_23189 [Ancylostoma caninum]|uniref:Uncharacterized protein n=1 Tax=Ancylostoma caninum TaxID=29170 RepID=A0A368FLJ6_ANCCA|nr:hypothetical protein ANCCAN_23189 [Ancylostoma caninum]